MIIEALLVFVGLLWLAYKYYTSKYTYWKDKGIPYVEPHFPFGTEKGFIFHTDSFAEHYQNHYKKFTNEKMIGLYMLNKPFLLIRGPDLIKHMLVKDFNHFVDRGLFDPELLSPVGRNLFITEGEAWRIMRTKLTPTFTSGKMKMMFGLMDACVDEFRQALLPVAEHSEEIDVKEFLARFTTDVISSCAFGLELGAIKNPDSEFRQNMKKIFQPPPVPEMIKQMFGFLLPQVYKFLRLPLISNSADDFFRKIVSDTVEYREKTRVVRNDFIDLLMKIKHNKSLSDDDQSDVGNGANTKDGNPKEGLTLDEMTAQALIFFLAGFETAASAMTFCLYELALNPNIQDSLRKETYDVLQRYSGKFTYQALQDMPFLDAVINETLRMYPLGILNRKCTEEYKFPDSNFVIPKGMTFIIPVYAIHHDPEYYPDPYNFDPERFMNDAIKTKTNFTFMPFGEGPRMCIDGQVIPGYSQNCNINHQTTSKESTYDVIALECYR